MQAVLVLGEVASDGGMNREHVQVVLRDARGVQVLDPLAGLEIHAGDTPSGDGGEERGHVVAQQLPLFAVQNAAPIGGLRPGDTHKDGAHALRVRIGQALQHQRVHNRKDSGIRANRKRQRKNHSQGEPWIAQQLAQGIAHILDEHFNRRKSPLYPVRFLRLRHPAEDAQRLSPRLLRGHAALQILFDGKADMGMQLFIEVFVEPPPAEQRGATAQQYA